MDIGRFVRHDVRNSHIEVLTLASGGGNLKQSGLGSHVIQPEKLQQIAERNK
jgi:hypothetical protein